MTTMSHVCLRVLDLERSTTFYRQHLGLTVQRELAMPDRGWQLRFLGDDTPHVALTAQDFPQRKARHREAGLICDELPSGIYFIQDPDGHLLEILPPK